MTRRSKILICGAGIAGPACAWWLNRYGYDVVIAEKARALRDGGQNVDIKGAGQTVIARMGLGERIDALGTRERGQKFLDADGRVVAVLPRGAFGCLTSDYEILRGDLASVMFEATRGDCDYRFGTAVAGLTELADGVTATFADGHIETFAAVICAEGIGSSTRAMMLGEETGFRHLGAAMAFFRIPARPEDDGWAHTVNAIGGTYLTLRQGREGETTVLMTFPSARADAASDGPDGRRAWLRRALVGRGGVAERVAAELDGVDDIYAGPMSQVQVSRWSKGRFVLLGDAAYCPTPFTGSGCALALVGAYVLAGEIARHADHAQAFAAYEALVRPYAEATQRKLSPAVIRLFHPRGRAGIALTHGIERLMASRPVQALLRPSDAARTRRVANDFELPVYW
jgi:2-polyprenyl-6-methoxyphenol hydroxylase-like FAD-dependent oxidoreductase